MRNKKTMLGKGQDTHFRAVCVCVGVRQCPLWRAGSGLMREDCKTNFVKAGVLLGLLSCPKHPTILLLFSSSFPFIHTASLSKPPTQSKGRASTHTHTYKHRNPSMQTNMHTCKHTSGIDGKSVSLAPCRLGSNLRSRSRELATYAAGAGREC